MRATVGRMQDLPEDPTSVADRAITARLAWAVMVLTMAVGFVMIVAR